MPEIKIGIILNKKANIQQSNYLQEWRQRTKVLQGLSKCNIHLDTRPLSTVLSSLHIHVSEKFGKVDRTDFKQSWWLIVPFCISHKRSSLTTENSKTTCTKRFTNQCSWGTQIFLKVLRWGKTVKTAKGSIYLSIPFELSCQYLINFILFLMLFQTLITFPIQFSRG